MKAIMYALEEALKGMLEWLPALFAYSESTATKRKAEIISIQDSTAISVDASAVSESRAVTQTIAGTLDGNIAMLSKDGDSLSFAISPGSEVVGVALSAPNGTTVIINGTLAATVGGLGSEAQASVVSGNNLVASYYQHYLQIGGVLGTETMSSILIDTPPGSSCQATIYWFKKSSDIVERVL